MNLDKLAQINQPLVFVRSSVGLDNFKLAPGKVWMVDDVIEDAVKVVPWPELYPSTERHIDRLRMDGDRAVGITPDVLGVSTAERPVAKVTASNLEEANKKFKAWTDSFRSGLIDMGYKLLECFAQYQPEYTYTDENGVIQTVQMPVGNIRDLIDLDLEISTEQMNMEIRREMSLLKYKLMSDYLTNMTGVAQALSVDATSPEFKKWLIEACRPAAVMMTKIMADFDEREPEKMVLNPATVMDTKLLMARAIAALPPPGLPPGNIGTPPGAGPGMGQPPGPGAMG
jgi:hypothetical protein